MKPTKPDAKSKLENRRAAVQDIELKIMDAEMKGVYVIVEPKKPEPAPVILLPCPLCAGSPRDRGHGIVCDGCGLWLGDGTLARRLGGYVKVWNERASVTR